MDNKDFNLKDSQPETGPRNWKEEQYEKLRGKISVQALTWIIVALVAAFFAVIVVGLVNK